MRLDVVQSNTGDKWLNDAFIDFHMSLWAQHAFLRAKVEASRKPPSVVFVSTQFFAMLTQRDYPGVRRWKQSIENTDFSWLDARYIFFPINVHGDHWVAAVLDTDDRIVYILDSMDGAHEYASHIGDRLINWAICDADHKRHVKKQHIIDRGAWRTLPLSTPVESQQKNNYDCGAFVLCFARDLLDKECIEYKDKDLVLKCSFDSDTIHDIRRVLIWDILDHGLDERPLPAREPRYLKISQVLDISQPKDVFYRSNRDANDRLSITLVSGNVERRLIVRQPFVLVLMNAQQGRWLWQCGHKQGIQLDSTFNTVRSRFSVFTVCVMHGSGYLPCAWFITSDECAETITYCLRTLIQRLGDDVYHPEATTWCPAVAMIDCSRSESSALEIALPNTKVFWCHWHVLKAMRENVLSKLPVGATRRKVSTYLHHLVTWCHPDDDAKGDRAWAAKASEFDAFMASRGIPEDGLSAGWSDAFRKYYDTQWRPNHLKWAKQYRSNVLYSIDTTGAVESFHSTWKARLKSTKGRVSQRRLDWMIHFLESNLLPGFVDRAARYDVRGAPTSKLNDILKLVDEADKVDDTNVTFTDPERRASIDDLGSEDIGSL